MVFSALSIAHRVPLLHENVVCHALQAVIALLPGRLKQHTQFTLGLAKSE